MLGAAGLLLATSMGSGLWMFDLELPSLQKPHSLGMKDCN